MAKLLVNASTGEQQILEVGVGGNYFDTSRVLWDERVDGDMPAIQLGGMKRVNDSLVFDAELLTAHNVAKAVMDNEEFNAPIKAQIAALDLKRIRPLAEGDTVYLAKLNEQIKALRAQMK